MADQRQLAQAPHAMLWRVLAMVAIAVTLVGFVLLLSRTLLAAPAGGVLLLALVWPRKLHAGTVPLEAEKESKTW